MPSQQEPRVAVAGCGHWGKNLVRNFAAAGALGAVVDRRPEVAARFAQEYDVPALSFDQALAQDGLDAIVLATPAETHGRLARRALGAGKHVFVEKPLALRVSEAEALVAAAAASSLVLMVGHLLQYHPAFLKLRKLIRNGELGRLQYIYSNRLNLGKIRREEDVFWSFAPHDISMILALAGEEPDSVTATAASYLHKSIADVTTTHLSFPSGIHAHIFVSWLHPFKEQKLVVVGDQGMAVFDDRYPWQEKLQIYAHKVDWHDGIPEPVKAEAVCVEIEESEPLRTECEHFLECVRDNRTPRTDGHEGLRVLRVLQSAAEEAAQAPMRGVQAPPAATGPGQLKAASDRGFFVHASSYVDEGCDIGPGTKIWHFSHILGGTRIGEDCVVGQNVMIGPDVTLGARCKIQNNVSIYKGVVLEDGVFCGPSCVFTNVINPRAEVERKAEFKETRVGRGATISANATIVCGHPIGEYSFIAAGSVVTKPVPPYALVAGVPATRIGWMSPAGERLGEDLTCPRTGQVFEQIDDDTLIQVKASREAKA